MPEYRRANVEGGTYFFTLVTYRRQPFLCDTDVRESLREAIAETRRLLPFQIDAWVLMPDHLHTLWTLPSGDHDFAVRWASIKRHVTKSCRDRLHREDLMTTSKRRRHESTLWQRRYWEHCIRDDEDFDRHMDYIHWNPVKHGLVSRVPDWPWSTFHRYVADSTYPRDWGGGLARDGKSGEFGEWTGGAAPSASLRTVHKMHPTRS